LQQGVCPNCGKKELFKCNRSNKCATELHVKDLYPDLFNAWSKRYPVTRQSPHAAADAYLREGRGFELRRLKGAYTQESYVDHKKT